MRDGYCISCAAWEQLSSGDERGYCRRFAPTNRPLTVNRTVEWPTTYMDDWCLDRIETTDE